VHAACGEADYVAFLNLAVNARDAMPDGGTLRISAGPEAIGPGHVSGLKTGNYIRFPVADTGTGMDEATLARAVEPFFSTKGVGKGTGLGLSMVHWLASQLGGAIIIQSHLDLGTTLSCGFRKPRSDVEMSSGSIFFRGRSTRQDNFAASVNRSYGIRPLARYVAMISS